jgi:AcrR family transcriptional regulator
MGFERASMDVVAAAAETSKRSLYAHFENKEKLYLEVIEAVRRRFLGRMGTPGDHSARPSEALVLFCGRYLEILLYESAIQMCRVSMAETGRFPEAARQHFDIVFTEIHTRLANYLKATFRITARSAADAAHRLLAQLLYPGFHRALFGMDPLAKAFGPDAISPDFDLKPVRKAVAELMKTLPEVA